MTQAPIPAAEIERLKALISRTENSRTGLGVNQGYLADIGRWVMRNGFALLAEIVAARAAAERGREEALAEGMDRAADFIFETLAKQLRVDHYNPADGSETWEGDVAGTLYAILVAGGIVDEETGELAALRAQSAAQPAADDGGVPAEPGWLLRDVRKAHARAQELGARYGATQPEDDRFYLTVCRELSIPYNSTPFDAAKRIREILRQSNARVAAEWVVSCVSCGATGQAFDGLIHMPCPDCNGTGHVRATPPAAGAGEEGGR